MKQTFIKGTIILIAASLIARVLGFVYRIFLSRIIGAEGMGLFQLAFPILVFILTIVTAGLPIAISKLVAEAVVINAKRRIRRILYLSIIFVLTLSAIFTILLIIYAPYISKTFLQDERSYYALIAMAPIITIAALSSILRGYFQGLQNMNPTAVSQVFEQIFRLSAVIYFASLWMPMGVEYAAAGAMVGMVCGELMGFIVLLVYYFKYKNKPFQSTFSVPSQKQSRRQILYSIAQTAVPVTFSRAIGSLTYALEPIIIAKSLALAGIATYSATAYYGQLAGMVIPLLIFPTVFTYSLSITLIPSISEANALEHKKTIATRVRQSIHFTLIIGVYFTVLLFTQAELLGSVLYNQPQIKHSLQILAPFAIFLYLQSPLAGILQGLGKANETMYNSLIGAIVKLAGIYILATRPLLNINGAVIAIGIGIITVTLLHIRSTRKYYPLTYPAKDMLKFLFMAGVIFISSQAISRYFSYIEEWALLVIIISISSIMYLIMLFGFKLITLDDFVRFRLIKRR
ncbi:stage V sporulation protein B [Desulfuribacillus alkaliarsenatis]|uniref:Stage V sporulation protein B n=1 Tax=Desulfuribacillus alkaliarsenatis TaxID=766136 RepID=A0A1E5G1L9_9FIRM|nr:stage V sporulation protein B [Desulfuribacillus alkaliarsenatis]OEF96338.1 stage V sporulation protein B [Desulfuribacillus alkaliarsenatis]